VAIEKDEFKNAFRKNICSNVPFGNNGFQYSRRVVFDVEREKKITKCCIQRPIGVD
jgi:hypothetical protein